MAKHRTKAQPLYGVIDEQGFYAVQRDGRHLMTPAGGPFRLPSRELAHLIAEEWSAQGDKIVPATMPFTQLAATAIDIIPQNKAKIIDALAAYTATELLCHFADTPDGLTEKQRVTWTPYLEWLKTAFDIKLVSGCGVMPIRQDPETMNKTTAFLQQHDAYFLVGLSSAVDALGSLVLGLALAKGWKGPEEVFEASIIDARYQALRWGSDPAAEEKYASLQKELCVCDRWFALIKST